MNFVTPHSAAMTAYECAIESISDAWCSCLQDARLIIKTEGEAILSLPPQTAGNKNFKVLWYGLTLFRSKITHLCRMVKPEILILEMIQPHSRKVIEQTTEFVRRREMCRTSQKLKPSVCHSMEACRFSCRRCRKTTQNISMPAGCMSVSLIDSFYSQDRWRKCYLWRRLPLLPFTNPLFDIFTSACATLLSSLLVSLRSIGPQVSLQAVLHSTLLIRTTVGPFQAKLFLRIYS